jgi:hypothetical protein
MLEFILTQPMPMLAYLEQYIENPWWDHAIDILPLVAAAPPQAWPLWTAEALQDEGLQKHLLRSLARWSAFRGSSHTEAKAALVEQLPGYLADLQAMPGACPQLADVAEEAIERLAYAVEARMQKFGEDVKGQGSCVLPSKTAHLLLPGYLPAYDKEVAVNTTLYNLIASTSSMSGYLMICWWVLQQFRREGNLQQARDSVARYMLSDWLLTTVRAQAPAVDHWLLRSMDSLVAEYTLIQMARTVEDDYLLRWLPAEVGAVK